MKKVAVQESSKDIHRVAKALKRIGFNLELIGNQRYVLQKPEEFTDEQLSLLRRCLQHCGHQRALAKNYTQKRRDN